MNKLFKLIKKHILPTHLLARFVLIILLPMILLQMLIAIFFYNRHWDTVSRQLANGVTGEIESVADWVKSDPPESEKKLSQMSEILRMQFIWKEGETLPEAGKTRKSPASSDLRSSLKSLPYPIQTWSEKTGKQQILIQLPKGILGVSVPRKRFYSSTVIVFLIWMVVSSLLLFGISFLFMKNQVRAMVRLARAAELFGMGQPVRFKPEGADEVRQAGQAFIEMKDRIERYLSERTTMLAGVSHDLRTPLTRMKLQLSMMEQDETIAALNQDITQVEHMLTGYLAFAKGEGKKPMERIELTPFITELVEKFRTDEFPIGLHIEEPLSIFGRPTELVRVFSNLLTNAQKYAHIANVSVGRRDTDVQIIIDDDGPGIPAKKRADAFKPFFRLDKTRNSDTNGVGLGLTIVRDSFGPRWQHQVGNQPPKRPARPHHSSRKEIIKPSLTVWPGNTILRIIPKDSPYAQ